MAIFGGVLLMSLGAVACNGGTTTLQRCPNTDPSSHETCMVSSDPGVAIGNAAAASAVWAAGGGCKINGCLPPMRCNAKTGLCEHLPCDEGHPCPAGYTCDDDSGTCH